MKHGTPSQANRGPKNRAGQGCIHKAGMVTPTKFMSAFVRLADQIDLSIASVGTCHAQSNEGTELQVSSHGKHPRADKALNPKGNGNDLA